jgi:hypothetical protein
VREGLRAHLAGLARRERERADRAGYERRPDRGGARQSAASTSSMICFEPTTPSPDSSYSAAK